MLNNIRRAAPSVGKIVGKGKYAGERRKRQRYGNAAFFPKNPSWRHCSTIGFASAISSGCAALDNPDGLPLVGAAQACSSVNLMGRPPQRGIHHKRPMQLLRKTSRFGRGLVGVFAVHDTISKKPSCHSDVVLEHYRRVAASLTFGETTPQRRMLANHENS
jgi:hypothetical protein